MFLSISSHSKQVCAPLQTWVADPKCGFPDLMKKNKNPHETGCALGASPVGCLNLFFFLMKMCVMMLFLAKKYSDQ